MKRVLILFSAVLTVIAAGCGCASDRALRSGDLVFVQIPEGYDLEDDSMAGAIGASTADGQALMTIHVAILEVERDSVWIIDATIKHGTDRYPLDTFLRDFTLKDGSLPHFEIKRADVSAAQAREFVENAKRYLGQPYDVHFLPDNGAMYCSELVYNAYVTEDGTHLFSEYPMNFRDASGQMPLYWTQLFALLGQDVPQDVPGTNPQRMSSEPVLRSVRAGFGK
ncbi:MAG: YiiX/YebB-like N1pC/P60 family cysteine hydrolase [Bacteroidia bacterium]|nr:YiiX/YebB-like N1pC/P60 family cysteine hydrolase [Bacteroidia bacterium]